MGEWKKCGKILFMRGGETNILKITLCKGKTINTKQFILV